MQCPDCEQHFAYHYILENEAEDGSEFDCPACGIALRVNVDEGTYYGAQYTQLEIVDD